MHKQVPLLCERNFVVCPQALKTLEYPEKLQRLLLTPQREVLVELVITKDNGEIETFNAYRWWDLIALTDMETRIKQIHVLLQ